MNLPITLSILCGALSPAMLEENAYYSEGNLRQTIRRLSNLPNRLEELEPLLHEELKQWGAILPEFTATNYFPSSEESPKELFTPLCRLREDELENTLRLSGYMEIHTPQISFHKTWLKAEERWLKLNLQQTINELRSDNEARILVSTTLNDIYHTIEIINRNTDTGQASVNNQLRLSLSKLYLDLTILFGPLMKSTDHINCNDLVYSACRRKRLSEGDELEYAILQRENLVKQIINGWDIKYFEDLAEPSPTTTENKKFLESALKLHEELSAMLYNLAQHSISSVRLQRGTTTLENYLYIMKQDAHSQLPDYEMMSSAEWTEEQLRYVRETLAIKDKHFADSRTALSWIEDLLDSPGISFLHPDLNLPGSIPQWVRKWLLKQEKRYEAHFAETFLTIDSDGKTQPRPGKLSSSKQHIEENVNKYLNFLRTERLEGELVLQDNELRILKDDLIRFLCGRTVPGNVRKVHPAKGYSKEIIYGACFILCKDEGVAFQVCADFLREAFVTSSEVESLVRNSGRCIDKYKKHS